MGKCAGTISGMVVGAISPVTGFRSLATSVGGGVASGAIVNVLSDAEDAATTDE